MSCIKRECDGIAHTDEVQYALHRHHSIEDTTVLKGNGVVLFYVILTSLSFEVCVVRA